MSWRDGLILQCPHCEAAFRASNAPLLLRILDEHSRRMHGTAAAGLLEPSPA